MIERLRIHHILHHTRANGPGLRAALWVQGCALLCPGCFNPETHSFGGGEIRSVHELFEEIAAISDIEGVSILGGEPLQQRRGVLALLQLIKTSTCLSVLLFTGFTEAEINRMPEAEKLLGLVDVLIAGRYDQSRRLARGLRGSSNKTVLFLSDRYRAEDLDAVPECEIQIGPEGEVIITGMDPMSWS